MEEWDYDNSVKEGIGGSETSIVEMSWRLAKRGHKVTVYAPIKKTTKPKWRGTTWLHFIKATFKEEGIWILYRCPEKVDEFKKHTKNQQVWLLWQDWDYQTLTKERNNWIDKHITLCKSHGKYILDKYKFIKYSQLWLSSNGIKADLIEEIEKENIKRNPLRIMYASSPDRGLKQALLILKKAREYVPNLELHAFYGFNNIDKLIKGKMVAQNHFLAKSRRELTKMIKETKNVHFHGRISQPDLYREWFKSGIYLYITNFFETSNIASQEAQAMGAVPVFSPIYAQGENIKHGIGIEGESNDPLTIARAAHAVVQLALQPELQEHIRKDMTAWARKRFDWENMVFQWECEAYGDRKQFELQYDFPEQLPTIESVFKQFNNEDFNYKTKPFEQITHEYLEVKGKTVLDVGGYDGKQANWCLEKGAKSAVVVDNGSWKTYQEWPEFTPFKKVKYINEDIFHYTNPADVVICQNVIYHIRNPWAFIERLRNLTQKLLVISTSYISGKEQIWKVYRPFEGHPVSWTVAWRPTIPGLKALLEANGFKIIQEAHANGHVVMKCKPVSLPIGFNKL